MSSLAFSSDSKVVAVGTGFGTVQEVQIWDLEARQRRARLRGHTGDVAALTFAGTDRLASASADGMVKVWDVGPKRRAIPQRVDSTSCPIRAIAFDASSRTFAVAAGKRVQLWDVPDLPHARDAR